MAVFECDIGNQGNGKSLRAARTTKFLFWRNRKWAQESGIIRKIASNQPVKVELLGTDAAQFFLPQWENVKELCKLRDCDIIWDEVANDLDARNFAMLSAEVKRFLSRADKRGLEIYCNTQDFDMIDKRARRMMTQVNVVSKLAGSQRPSNTKKVVEKPWGFFWVREFINYKDEKAIMDPAMRELSFIPEDYFFLRREDFELFDTHFESGAKNYPPLEHIEQECEIHGNGCSFKKTSHL